MVAPVRRTLAAIAAALAVVASHVVAERVAGGEPVAKPAAAVPRPPAQPRFDGLDLVGTVVAGAASTAIIAEAGGAQRAYRIGDRVRDGVAVEAIARDGVTLAAGETRQRLSVKRSPGAGAAPPQQSPLLVPAVAIETPAPAVPVWDRRNSTPGMPLHGSLTSDPGGGYRLEGVKPGSPYERLGLLAGDVLLSVNGKPFESPEQLWIVYKDMRMGGEGEVVVLRDRRPETLRPKFKSAAR